ncbi:hypothetical protein NX059_003517 [Plenodomus lindquistii]|nr:hypothetical protein NX059_003517 [Plenodomus lindquistii]
MSTKRTAVSPVILQRGDIETLPLETFDATTAGGNVHWRTLISAPKTSTDTFTVGVATCPAGGRSAGCPASTIPATGPGDSPPGCLKAHRHSHAELYHVTAGTGVVTIDGVEHGVSKGSVVFIPGDAEHGVRNTGEEELEWLYVFAAKGFEEIVYRFSGREEEDGTRRALRGKL